MADIKKLAKRIDAEFSAVADKVKKFQAEQVQEHKDRQQRMQQLSKVFDELRDIWRPRMEFLAEKFGDHVKVTPRIVPATREVTFEFQSRVARVNLKLAAYTDREVKKVTLSYDLDIIPVLMRFVPHAEVEFPLDKVDKNAVADWIDDRIIDFVQTYLSLGETEAYMKDHMVEDPIAHVRFPNLAAGATLEWNGKKFYFVGEETRREFAKQNNIALV